MCIDTLRKVTSKLDHHSDRPCGHTGPPLVRPYRLTSKVTPKTHTSTGAGGSARAASACKNSGQQLGLERREVAWRASSRRRLDLDEDGGPEELGDELGDKRSAKPAQDGQVQQGAEAQPPSRSFTDSFLSSMEATGSFTSSPAAHRDGR